jgi:ribosomal protein S18 acetylase RimI-like enzyme
MTGADIEPSLDNPFWASLVGRHAHLARGGALARRYPPDISPLSGLSAAGPENIAALESLVGVGDDMALTGRFVPELPRNWETLFASRLTQMVRSDRTPLPEGDVAMTILGGADVAEMLDLVALTKPGPFRTRTIELGTYVGIRDGARLIAMAGERMWIGDFREVSAVCTHPDATGRGYARALIARVVNGISGAGQTPFLHVESNNRRAIDLYLALGFAKRAEFPLLYARRIG